MNTSRRSNNIPSDFGQKSSSHILERHLTDSCAFIILRVVALALNELFPYEWDQKFNEKCLSRLWQHLLKNEKRKVDISVLLKFGDINNLIDVLLKDSEISGKQCLLIQQLLLFAVKEGKYDARMRVLIQHLALLLKVPVEIVDFYEDSVIDYLQNSSEITKDDPKEIKKRQRKNKIKQYALIGLASVSGGAILGVTGGLAAPLLVAGVETLLGAGSIALLSSSLGGTIIGSLFGVAGAGLAGHKMKKRVGDIEEFEFVLFTGNSDNYSSLNITVAISGWLSDEQPDNFRKPWIKLMNSREQYYLRYESKYLLECGRAMSHIFNFAATMAAQELLKHTIVGGIISAVTWPASLLTLASLIDNPWAVCCKRAEEVGKKLADVLMLKCQGERPVTLIGYSLGARVIFYCLKEMSERAGCEGIVQDAILLGTPVTRSVKLWNQLSRVVSGRIVNGYSKKDWFLMFVHRAVSMAFGVVAGIQPVNSSDKKIVNVDLTHLIFGHADYSTKVDKILKFINIRTLDEVPMCLPSGSMKKSSSDSRNRLVSTSKIDQSSLRLSKSEEAIHRIGQ